MNNIPLILLRGGVCRFVGIASACLSLIAFTPTVVAGVIVSNNFSSEVVPVTGNPLDWGVTVTSAGCFPEATAAITADGTVDVGTNTRTAATDPVAPAGIKSAAMTLNATFAASPWRANLQTQVLAMGANTESAPAKLNLSFDLQTNQIRPITVRIRTWNDASPGADGDPSDKFTGERSGTLMPVVAGAPYRYSIDLDTLTEVVLTPTRPTGYDSFDLLADGTGTDGKRVQVIFGLQGASTDAVNWPAGLAKISVDNISITSPRYYVSPAGGGSGADADHPATLAAIMPIALPGDVICLNGGAEYTGGLSIAGVAGTPSRWITIRPSDSSNPPVLRNTDWNVIGVNGNVSYLDIHGVTVKGYLNDAAQIAAGLTLANAIADGQMLNTYPGHETDPAYTIYPDSPADSGAVNIYYGAGKFNANGIVLNGRVNGDTETGIGQGIHHIRIANNFIYDNTAAGIAAMKADYLTIEGNTCSNNNRLSRYGGSGISSLTPVDFDGTTGYKIFVVRNTSNGNGSDVRWGPRFAGDPTSKTVTIAYSDGNGIIIDTHRENQYVGRSVVLNNVVYDNGGSGIHEVASDHVDIANNTAYHNALANRAPAAVTDQVWQVSSAGLHGGSPPFGVYVDVTPANPKKGGDSLNYGQIFAGAESSDIRIVNNVMWAWTNNFINAPMPTYLSGDVSYDNNVFGRDGGNPWDVTPYDPANVGIASSGFYSFTGNIGVTDDTPAGVFSNYTDPGTTATYLHLNTTGSVSPAIDAGIGVNDAGTPFVPGDDRAGVCRPRNGGGGVDIGAFEDQ